MAPVSAVPVDIPGFWRCGALGHRIRPPVLFRPLASAAPATATLTGAPPAKACRLGPNRNVGRVSTCEPDWLAAVGKDVERPPRGRRGVDRCEAGRRGGSFAAVDITVYQKLFRGCIVVVQSICYTLCRLQSYKKKRKEKE